MGNSGSTATQRALSTLQQQQILQPQQAASPYLALGASQLSSAVPTSVQPWMQLGSQTAQNIRGVAGDSMQSTLGTTSQVLSTLGGGASPTSTTGTLSPVSTTPLAIPTLPTTPSDPQAWATILQQYGLNGDVYAAPASFPSADIFVGLDDDGAVLTVPLARTDGLEWASAEAGLNYYYEPALAGQLRARCPQGTVARWPHSREEMMF